MSKLERIMHVILQIFLWNFTWFAWSSICAEGKHKSIYSISIEVSWSWLWIISLWVARRTSCQSFFNLCTIKINETTPMTPKNEGKWNKFCFVKEVSTYISELKLTLLEKGDWQQLKYLAFILKSTSNWIWY